jgi:hypothetical protein
MEEYLRRLHEAARAIQREVPRLGRPPAEGAPPETEQVIPHSVVHGTRGYIEKLVHQVNGCYERGWYDACAVITRRLIEVVIIEAFEEHGIAAKIQNKDGDFLYLGDLIDAALTEPSWNLGRNTKRALPRLKGVGDRSAHSRRFTAHLKDVEKNIDDLRDVIQEFIYLADLK